MAEVSVPEKKKFKLKMPHAYVLILAIILVAAVMSLVIPAGEYNMVKDATSGRTVVDPTSYHRVARSPVGLWKVMKAIPQGMNNTAGIIFMILVIGGAMQIINVTGVFEASLGRAVHKLKKNGIIVVPFCLLFFSILGACNVNNSIVAFVPLGILLATNIGADVLVGISMITMGMNIGFSAGAFSAPTVGTAQTIIGLPLFSGSGFRLATQGVLFVFGSIFLVRYALKVRKDSTKSVVYGMEGITKVDTVAAMPEFNVRRKVELLVVAAGFGLLIYGSFKGWNANVDIPAIFLSMGILVGLIHGLAPSKIAAEFVNGAKSLTFGALIVGVSSAIGGILTEGKIIHTVIHGLSGLLVGMPKVLSAVMMYIIQTLISFVIVSGSGMAAATIPIMSAVGDVLGLSQQTVVLAFQYADGFSNQIMPMSSVLMGSLAFANVPLDKWYKFVWKWILMNMILGAVFVVAGTLMNLGPF